MCQNFLSLLCVFLLFFPLSEAGNPPLTTPAFQTETSFIFQSTPILEARVLLSTRMPVYELLRPL